MNPNRAPDELAHLQQQQRIVRLRTWVYHEQYRLHGVQSDSASSTLHERIPEVFRSASNLRGSFAVPVLSNESIHDPTMIRRLNIVIDTYWEIHPLMRKLERNWNSDKGVSVHDLDTARRALRQHKRLSNQTHQVLAGPPGGGGGLKTIMGDLMAWMRGNCGPGWDHRQNNIELQATRKTWLLRLPEVKRAMAELGISEAETVALRLSGRAEEVPQNFLEVEDHLTSDDEGDRDMIDRDDDVDHGGALVYAVFASQESDGEPEENMEIEENENVLPYIEEDDAGNYEGDTEPDESEPDSDQENVPPAQEEYRNWGGAIESPPGEILGDQGYGQPWVQRLLPRTYRQQN